MSDIITCCVLGTPVGQGRLSAIGRGRVIHSNAKTLLPWRQDIAGRVAQEMGGRPPLEGPVWLSATFIFTRPKTAGRDRWAPHKRPDLDHLVRALLDGITAGGGWADDAQVIAISASKMYGDSPAAVFSFSTQEPDEASRTA
jgi:Holliday junction resolvase RusA-like endonuclease